jgi:hypothetical protein
LRRDLCQAGTIPIMPGTRARKHPVRHDKRCCKHRRHVEAAICRLKDLQRMASAQRTTTNLDSAAALAASSAFWG